jgi:hypothetical protein
MINRRNIGLALGMVAAVLLTAGAMIASTARASGDEKKIISIQAVPVSTDTRRLPSEQ